MRKIFDYLDYRDFLKDYYEERKAQSPFFSYRVFATQVGLDTSYLAKVLMGKRHLAARSIGRVATYCGLQGREAECFEALVHFAKAKTERQSRLYFEKVLASREAQARTLMYEQYEYFTRWYYSAIRSMIEYIDFRDDYGLLGSQLNPPIGAREARKAVKLLEKLGLIRRTESGRYVQTEASVTTGPEWSSAAIQAFQEETIALAREALERHPKETRDISTITMALNREQFDEVRERIREFRSLLIKYVNEGDAPDRVYHLNMQFIPLTRVPREQGK